MRAAVEPVDSFDPKRKFACARCARLGMVSPKGVSRRFRVVLRNEGGTPEDFCIVCAAILTGRRQGEFMRAGRPATGEDRYAPKGSRA